MSKEVKEKSKDLDMKTYAEIGSILHKLQSLSFEGKDEVVSQLEKAKNQMYNNWKDS